LLAWNPGVIGQSFRIAKHFEVAERFHLHHIRSSQGNNRGAESELALHFLSLCTKLGTVKISSEGKLLNSNKVQVPRPFKNAFNVKQLGSRSFHILSLKQYPVTCIAISPLEIHIVLSFKWTRITNQH
jgi:hypothetical protein